MKRFVVLCLTLCLLLCGCGRLPVIEEPPISSGTLGEQSAVAGEQSQAASSSSLTPEAPGSSNTVPETPPAGDTASSEGVPETPPAGASSSEAQPEEGTQPSPWLTLEGKSASGNPATFAVPEDGVYTFRWSDGAAWTLYVLDAPFEDGLRYLPQGYRPVTLGAENTLALKAGYQVYCLCPSGGAAVMTVDYQAETVEAGALSPLR